MRGTRWADEPSSIEDMKRKVPKTVGDSFALMEREMVEGPWVLGKSYTICDPYLFTLGRGWSGMAWTSPASRRFHDQQKRMMERPAVKKVLADEKSSRVGWAKR